MTTMSTVTMLRSSAVRKLRPGPTCDIVLEPVLVRVAVADVAPVRLDLWSSRDIPSHWCQRDLAAAYCARSWCRWAVVSRCQCQGAAVVGRFTTHQVEVVVLGSAQPPASRRSTYPVVAGVSVHSTHARAHFIGPQRDGANMWSVFARRPGSGKDHTGVSSAFSVLAHCHRSRCTRGACTNGVGTGWRSVSRRGWRQQQQSPGQARSPGLLPTDSRCPSVPEGCQAPTCRAPGSPGMDGIRCSCELWCEVVAGDGA
jgi:hypothetical protein